MVCMRYTVFFDIGRIYKQFAPFGTIYISNMNFENKSVVRVYKHLLTYDKFGFNVYDIRYTI